MSAMNTSTALPENVVETDGLTKRFGERTVVRDVELRVPRGVAFGYLGPNGAGKTTLIRMLLGLTPATSGEMRLLGLPGRRRVTLHFLDPIDPAALPDRKALTHAAREAIRQALCEDDAQPV